jgi:beta-glucosidase
MPAVLEDEGGWTNPDSVRWFADYAAAVFRALGDRVPLWATLNEPWVVTDAGYLHGVHPPGRKSLEDAATAFHHLLSAHAAAVRTYRSGGWREKIGLVLNLEPKYPATDRREDIAAAERADAYNNLFGLDPVFLGRYPRRMTEIFGDAWPRFGADEVAQIHEPIDFLGVNYYTRRIMCHDDSAPFMNASAVPVKDAVTMTTGWEVYPSGLTDTLLEVTRHYGRVPLYVTENGAAFPDPDTLEDGALDDPLRTQYYRSHLCAVRDAIQQGADVRGYFAWSLLDNFEWNSGYAIRFGLVHVDYATQRRTPKASAQYYREVIRSNGLRLNEPLPAAAR